MPRKFLLNMCKIDQRIWKSDQWARRTLDAEIDENCWIVSSLPAFQPSSDHSVAPWGGALLKSTICSSAAFRCASISRRALCHSLTQKTLRWGCVWINGFSTSSEEERGQHMSQTFINSFPKRIFVLIFWLLLFTPSKNK